MTMDTWTVNIALLYFYDQVMNDALHYYSTTDYKDRDNLDRDHKDVPPVDRGQDLYIISCRVSPGQVYVTLPISLQLTSLFAIVNSYIHQCH